MSKFVLTNINDDIVTTKEFDTEYLFDVLERFEEFLRGCGYVFNGTLDFVQEDGQTMAFPQSVIFESPDKGKTVFSRNFGEDERTQISPDGC